MASLYGAKAWYTRRLDVFLRFAVRRDLSPDIFTVVGVLFAALAAFAILFGWWPLVFLALAGRLAGANLDGAVARARGVSRPFGFVLNEIGDRISDYLPLLALAWIAYRTGSLPVTALMLLAVLAASLPTFISLAAAGAGGRRLNGGPYGKTERCLTIFLTATALAYLPPTPVLAVTAALLIAGSLLTTVTRTLSARKQLRVNT